MAAVTVFRISELATSRYRATLKDDMGTVLGVSSLASLTLTLYDRATGSIINSRNNQNVKGASGVAVNGVTVWDVLQTDADGVQYNVAWEMSSVDNPIVTPADPATTEIHVALFKWTWGSGLAGNHEIGIRVENVKNVGAS